MEYMRIIINRLIVMVIYAAIGFILHKTKLVSKQGCTAFSTLLVYILLPCVIIQSFLRDFSALQTRSMLLAMVISIGLLLLSCVVSSFLFRKEKIDAFSSAFSNAGFMGVPLIASALGQEAVFYSAGFVAFLNILQWVYGQTVLVPTQGKKRHLSACIRNPLMVALVIGLACYFFQLPLPEQLRSCISTLSACNTPVAMIILGYYLCEIPLRNIFTLPAAYAVSLSRLLLVPILSIGVLALVPGVSTEIKMALVIVASAPVGINAAVYAQRLNLDYTRAVILICHSTVFSVITMPLIVLCASMVFQ